MVYAYLKHATLRPNLPFLPPVVFSFLFTHHNESPIRTNPPTFSIHVNSHPFYINSLISSLFLSLCFLFSCATRPNYALFRAFSLTLSAILSFADLLTLTLFPLQLALFSIYLSLLISIIISALTQFPFIIIHFPFYSFSLTLTALAHP
jgi:hypothetical protein